MQSNAALFWILPALLLMLGFSLNATEEQSIDALFRDFSGANTPGAAIAVIKHGKVVFEKAYGAAVLESGTACSIQTNFRLASLTKQFTSMCILMLAEHGKLSLDDSITKYFPEFPAYGKAITLRHLLSHTSGLIDYEDVIPEGTTLQLCDRDVLTLVRKQDHTYFPPGSQFRYSNSGYVLLGMIVESVSGETFPSYLKRHIFDPLGMTGTVAYVAGVSEVSHRAYGYAKGDKGWEFSDQSVTSATLGDGGVYSSVVDLFKWDQALYSEKLVSRKTLEQAFTAHSPVSDFEGSGYGFGWYVATYEGTRQLWHYGSTCGFSTRIHRFPEKQMTVIVLTNRRDAELEPLVHSLIRRFW